MKKKYYKYAGLLVVPLLAVLALPLFASADAVNTDTGDSFGTIQAAIDSASTTDGHTIVVDADTYDENITIDKELTIEGANASTSASDGPRDPESVIDGSVEIQSSNVTIDGFTILNGSSAVSGSSNEVGIYLVQNSNNVVIENNILEKTDGSAPDSGDSSRGVLTGTGGVDDLTIQDNLSTGWHSGLYLDNISNSTVVDNTLEGNFVGVSFDSADDVTFEANNVFDNGFEGIGVGVGASNLTINQNNIVGNDDGLDNYTDDGVDAEENWWGDQDGPSGDGSGSGDSVNGGDTADGSVDFSPWLCNEAISSETTTTGDDCEPKDTEHIDISGDTSDGENQEGWLFNRDEDTQTEFEFNDDEMSIGDGALYVEPIDGSFNGDDDKFVGEYFLLDDMGNLEDVSYDFMIGDGGDTTDDNEFYMNVYANFAESDEDKFYDCRYDIVPTNGSTADFTTVTFDPDDSYPVTTRTGDSASPHECPDVPADMGSDATVRMFSLNVGDTSDNDDDLDGYLDRVVLNTTDTITTFDFEPEDDDGDDDDDSDDGDDDDGEEGEKETVCHRPPGNPANAHTIHVGENAVDAHLAHGDVLGECDDEDESNQQSIEERDGNNGHPGRGRGNGNPGRGNGPGR